MIEMNDRKYDSQLRTKFQQKAKKSHRIRAARGGHAHAVSRAEEGLLSNVVENRLGQLVHRVMVQPMHELNCENRVRVLPLLWSLRPPLPSPGAYAPGLYSCAVLRLLTWSWLV